MTSNINIPNIQQDNQINMSEITTAVGLKGLVGRKASKTVKFLEADVKIQKLSVAEVMDIQAKAKELDAKAKEAGENADNDAEEGISMLKLVIRKAVEGGDLLTDEDFLTFPLGDLKDIVETVMRYSGLSADEAGN